MYFEMKLKVSIRMHLKIVQQDCWLPHQCPICIASWPNKCWLLAEPLDCQIGLVRFKYTKYIQNIYKIYISKNKFKKMVGLPFENFRNF
jgi:hypothetical protein